MAPSGACASVPANVPHASHRTRLGTRAKSDATAVARVTRIVKNATTRFENSTYE